MPTLFPNTTPENPLGLDDPTLFIQASIINGEHITRAATFVVDDPATGNSIGTCPDMGVDDVRTAIDTAHSAFQSFRATPPLQRQAYLTKLHSLILNNADDLARLIVWENGKAWPDAVTEVAYAASYVQWFAGEAVRQNGEVIAATANRSFVIKQPIGVCALLVPWNFPIGMIARKVAPALATGCTAVVKVPSETPYTNLAFVELVHRAGVPGGVVNVVTTHKHLVDVGKELTTNTKIAKVSFTGSTRVGKILAGQASTTLKKLSLELGGNAPLIVFEDADIPTAVMGTLASKFRGSGQTCVCANRIYVHESVYEAFATALAEKVKLFRAGPGFADGVTHGPLIHKAAADKVVQHIDDAVARGARVMAGGRKISATLLEPTLLVDVAPDCLLTTEETFGPLAALIRFSTEDEVLRLANASEVGLAGYFFSNDADRIWRVAEVLQVGMVGANTGVISSALVPFGGVKESGYGKEGGREGTDEYLVKKLVVMGSRV
ncbi:Putative succinate-semialdehyde dehydrogenasec [NADP(+)] [Vanrija pseudolonga]|uniref:succinate-semialdehyde dehydrogenase [NAD(P)(+)] n=1 Tax=Vanrija pseudolonga TaxID=143232 RepID=A0AAF0YKU9_9TREE|nr:Putative succinate-semialdehyde dehydrogenasec [NADP(+)] [Vanrija pseudolonga]